MNKVFFYIFISLFFSCTKTETDISKVKESVYIPSTYKLIDLRKSKDFLTDGSSEIIIVFEIVDKEYDKFIERNKLIKFKKSYRWADYYTEDFNFYPYNIKEELKLSKCKDLDKFYYNHWRDSKASIECFFDSNIGLVVVNYEYQK
ncbi:MAG: hypothetical protein LBE34_02405 [Flavobacteriaceae bacterium]|jgi:hypothetical protein|nr:hypothetical protein [Flavobacteriaceae bacterium]